MQFNGFNQDARPPGQGRKNTTTKPHYTIEPRPDTSERDIGRSRGPLAAPLVGALRRSIPWRIPTVVVANLFIKLCRRSSLRVPPSLGGSTLVVTSWGVFLPFGGPTFISRLDGPIGPGFAPDRVSSLIQISFNQDVRPLWLGAGARAARRFAFPLRSEVRL